MNAIQLKIQLRHIRPPIWRRGVVPESATLGDLHVVIQIAMGWENGHMHCFRIGPHSLTSSAMAGPGDDLRMRNADRVRLAEIAAPRRNSVYEYDFGDGSEHEIIIEKMLPADPNAKYPRCLGGVRACPPEDCGGYPGYADLRQALKTECPTEEQRDLLAWLGDRYDPEFFDVKAVNLSRAASVRHAARRRRT